MLGIAARVEKLPPAIRDLRVFRARQRQRIVREGQRLVRYLTQPRNNGLRTDGDIAEPRIVWRREVRGIVAAVDEEHARRVRHRVRDRDDQRVFPQRPVHARGRVRVPGLGLQIDHIVGVARARYGGRKPPGIGSVRRIDVVVQRRRESSLTNKKGDGNREYPIPRINALPGS